MTAPAAQPGVTGGNPVIRRIVLLALTVLLLFLLVRAFPVIDDIISVIVISLVISYAMRPLMTYLERRGINRVVTILILFVLFAAVITLAIAYLVPRLIEQLSAIGSTLNQIDVRQIRDSSLEWIEQYFPALAESLREETGEAAMIADRARGIVTSVIQQSANVLAGLVNFFSLLSIMPILIFFMLKDGRLFTRSVVARVPNRFFEMTMSLLYKVNRTIGDYIVSVVISSLFVGATTWLGLSIIGVRYSLALAVVGGLFNVIPFFGPLLTIVVTSLLIILTEDPFVLPLVWAVIVLFLIQQVESIVVKPMLLSHSMSIHPAVVIIAVLIGGRIAGPIGMFIAVPVYSIIHMVIVDLYQHLKDYRII
ncbi:MAG: putative transport protein YhhT [Calditrichaeota bacterium]|nr:putative transport protein YhhT [Calditrichota bacterium]